MTHAADALVIACMDFRMHRPGPPNLSSLVSELGFSSWDLRTQQGGVKDLLGSGGNDRQESLLDAVRIAVDLHGVRTVLLVNHEDCGAYGGARAFRDARAERDRHVTDLTAARSKLLRAFPDLRVRSFYVHLAADTGRPSLEDVTQNLLDSV